MQKSLIAAAAIALSIGGAASAATFQITGGTATGIASNNNFSGNLSALGYTSLVTGSDLSIQILSPARIEIYLVGAESGYTNRFTLGSFSGNEGNQSFDINRLIQTVLYSPGEAFGFQTQGSGPLVGPGDEGFGIFVKGPFTGNLAVDELVLGFDDDWTKGRDNDYEDYVVRLALVSGIPEPAAWITMIAGFGLVGSQLRRRKLKTILA